jgi:hypothetical protein
MPADEAALVVAVVVPLIAGIGLLVLLIIALVCWWLASSAAEREWRESERTWHRSGGGVVTTIRESPRHKH